ncbi:hypothetical protein [Coraliomargarita parva]|uniref:hypothetical protein n=1 Tax=Coraliomargarita parva TaxID=3014050 RepID=UPI0022B4DF7C|nr:hypothetical protein [Coraliomargarita parva]
MSETTMTQNSGKGLRYARWAGKALGYILILSGSYSLGKTGTVGFECFKGLYFIFYGLLLHLPYTHLPERIWKIAFAALAIISAIFVFVMIISVMFSYMAAAERGERLGVPGLEGTLIFLALLQVPVVLFQHKPELID